MFKWFSLGGPILATALCSGSMTLASDLAIGTGSNSRHGAITSSFGHGAGLPSHVKGIGTYAGAIQAVRFGKNGIYFSAERGGTYLSVPSRQTRVTPQIIYVNKQSFSENCEYEAGVCVIRP